ncbi:MAG: DNA-binding protein [Desulfocapsa sp.]|nr:DNA-binding protein [Desulfocapsa sp.]
MKKTLLNGIAIFLFISFAAFNGYANPGAGQTLSGKVLETMDAGGYTYIQLDTGTGQPWVAIPQATVKVGDEVNCQPGMAMSNFNSKTLNRTFDSIIFSGGLAGAAGNQAGGAMGSMGSMGTPPPAQGGDDSFASAVQAESGGPAMQQAPAAESGGSLGAQAPFSEIKVEKASGDNGYTVSEIFAQKDSLGGKTVAIKGKVVKFSPMIMGRNWIHLQDGTGDPMANTHDLVVTTSEEVTNGDVITVEGVLAIDKDFGAGYKYDAIVEDAKTLK